MNTTMPCLMAVLRIRANRVSVLCPVNPPIIGFMLLARFQKRRADYHDAASIVR
jgi:hypothetical protein